MELSYLVFTGSVSGLVSILGHSVLWSLIELVRPRRAGAADPQVQIAEAFLHMVLGVALGLLFWLSWGLAAIVEVAWWIRGLAFSALAMLLMLPMLLNLLLTRRIEHGLLAVFASRWITTCLVAGLSCAWSWERSV
jgi:hypothetical protein